LPASKNLHRNGLMHCSNGVHIEHLVGELLKMQRHIEAKRVCDLQIYHQIDLGQSAGSSALAIFPSRLSGRLPMLSCLLLELLQSQVDPDEPKSASQLRTPAADVGEHPFNRLLL
jgi:hypothetical protein